ncbi:MAG: transcription elongation factor GreA [Patescibacteria group bacterium]|nr:transcription elongation factor GreA [Patescibacteria group bacterium]
MNNQITRNGFEKLKKELEELKEKRRPKVVERLTKARAMGDLSENSEYTAAREELNFIEGRIEEIERILREVKVVEDNDDNQVIQLGQTVILERDSQKITLTLVGEYEADPMNGKISVNSPIGKNLIGRKTGEIIRVETPSGIVTYKVLEIRKN